MYKSFASESFLSFFKREVSESFFIFSLLAHFGSDDGRSFKRHKKKEDGKYTKKSELWQQQTPFFKIWQITVFRSHKKFWIDWYNFDKLGCDFFTSLI